MSNFIYLASQSPRRAELLAQLGVSHQLLLADASEDAESLEAMVGLEPPKTYVQRVTSLKLTAAIARAKKRGWFENSDSLSHPILCADTTVALGRSIYGKPKNARDAARMLQALSGRTHRVLTAVGVAWRGEKIVQSQFALSESRVTFATLSKREIDNYVATQEPFGKAGAYGVQGKAAGFITKITGSYSGIMGLPLHETTVLLKAAHFL